VSSNERRDAPSGGQPAAPKQRAARPAPRVQRVKETADPRAEKLDSGKPSSKPSNRSNSSKKSGGGRPLVVAPDFIDGIPNLKEVPPIVGDERSSNGSNHGAPADSPAVENPTIEVASQAVVPGPPKTSTRDLSRKRRPGGARKATTIDTGVVGPPLGPPLVDGGVRPTAMVNGTSATAIPIVQREAESPGIARAIPGPAALAPGAPSPPLVVPLPFVTDESGDPDTFPDADADSTVARGRTVIHYGPGGRRRRPRVRRVTRVVRHVDPWSVFKVALCFSLVLYGVCLTAGVLLWNVAYTTGTVDNVERFFESFGWDTFKFKGGELYHNAWIAGLFMAVGLTGLIVLGATLFNLITDLVGGIRVTVLEEEVVERHPSVGRPLLRRRTGEIRMVNEVPAPEPTMGPSPMPEPPPPAPVVPPGFLS